MKINKITLILFLLAAPCYWFSDKVGISLAVFGVILEIIGWITLFDSNTYPKNTTSIKDS